MKLLYIQSNIGWIFDYINQYIINALIRLNINLKVVRLENEGKNILEIVKNFKPNIIFCILGHGITATLINQMKKFGAKTACWYVDDPYTIDLTVNSAKYFDYVFTIDSNCVRYYMNSGCKKVFFVPLGVDESVFYPIEVDDFYKSDICFVGSAFPNRIELIDKIAPYIATRKVRIIGQWWDRLKSYDMLRPYITGNIMNPYEIMKFYRGAKINLNIHRYYDCPILPFNKNRIEAYTPNNRTFEIAACNSFQLTDYRKDLDKFYEIGSEIIVFKDERDLIDKIEYYLSNPYERERISYNSYLRTISKHTYVCRLSQILNVIKND